MSEESRLATRGFGIGGIVLVRMFAAEIRLKRIDRMRAFSNWCWRVDEHFVRINGERCYRWRAVDHEGEVLEAVVTKRRNKSAALKLLKKLINRYGRAKAIVTDRLPSYSAALKALGAKDLQATGRWLNNRVENSHRSDDERVQWRNVWR